jgi:hypothetical protein
MSSPLLTPQPLHPLPSTAPNHSSRHPLPPLFHHCPSSLHCSRGTDLEPSLTNTSSPPAQSPLPTVAANVCDEAAELTSLRRPLFLTPVLSLPHPPTIHLYHPARHTTAPLRQPAPPSHSHYLSPLPPSVNAVFTANRFAHLLHLPEPLQSLYLACISQMWSELEWQLWTNDEENQRRAATVAAAPTKHFPGCFELGQLDSTGHARGVRRRVAKYRKRDRRRAG